MAACQWKGGKCKSVQQAKAFFRHNDKERREEHHHTNHNIDKSKTHLNYSYFGRTYEQLCKAYDDRLNSINVGRMSTGKNARTVMQSVIIYPPESLVSDPQKLHDWFMDAGAICEARFGENMIDMAVDMDEVHEYKDYKTGEARRAREHAHLWLVPEVGGKLNGKEFFTRANVTALNNELQAMSLSKYHTPMMDGSKAKGGDTVEDLKAKSRAREIVAKAQADALLIESQARAQAQAEQDRLKEKEKALAAREQKLQDQVDAQNRRERGLKLREARLACQLEELPGQMKLAAQKAVREEIEAARAEHRQRSTTTAVEQAMEKYHQAQEHSQHTGQGYSL